MTAPKPKSESEIRDIRARRERGEKLSSIGIDLVEHVQRNLGDGWLVCLGVHGDVAVHMREGVTRIAREQ